MAKKTKQNRYSKKAQRSKSTLLTEPLPAKGSVKNAFLESGLDLLVGAIGGGAIGAAVGKPALIAGFGTVMAGHYTGQRFITLAGVGMMAASTFQSPTVSGLEGLDGAKERLLAFKADIKQKLYLDKIFKKPADTVSGMGELQYFNYANELSNLNGGLAALDNYEQQLEENAINRMQLSGGSIGAMETIEAMDGGLADVEDYNL